MDEVEGWSEDSFAAAIASVKADDARCPSCGLSDDDMWAFTAVATHCAGCHDRDDKAKALSTDGKKPAGVHLRWQGSDRLGSAAGMFTPEGAMERALGN